MLRRVSRPFIVSSVILLKDGSLVFSERGTVTEVKVLIEVHEDSTGLLLSAQPAVIKAEVISNASPASFPRGLFIFAGRCRRFHKICAVGGCDKMFKTVEPESGRKH